jgi:hypothetical protein
MQIIDHRLILLAMPRDFHFHAILSLDLLLREKVHLWVEILNKRRNLGLKLPN